MASIYQKFAVVAKLAALSLIVIEPNSAQAIQIIPSGYQVEEISTGSFELVEPNGLAIDSSNNIYVSRNFFGINRSSDLLKITPTGEVSSIASFNSFIGGLAINENNQIFGALSDGSIFRLEDGNVNTFASGLPEFLAELTFDQNNNLFVASIIGKNVFKISPDGEVSLFANGLERPIGVAFRNESLFIGDGGGVRQVTASGTVTDFLSPIPGLINDLEYEPTSDSFFVANQIRTGRDAFPTLNVITNGQISTFAEGFLGERGRNNQAYPHEIEFDFSGNLYVTDAQKLYKISKSQSAVVPEPSSGLALLAFCFIGAGSALKKKLAK